MMYKLFAGATLIAAPLIVLAVQSAVPTPPQPAAPQEQAAPTPPAPVQPTPPPVAMPATPQDAPLTGQPMADAGQPSLDLNATPSGSGTPFGEAPPGSPNAEP